MAALPYMPLYVADYLADAAHLSTVQHGAYLLLIMNYWQRGEPLPNDDARLARIARLSPKEWARHRETISEFFEVDEFQWGHRRIDSELARVEAKSLKSKKAAAASVERRLSKRSANAKRTLNHTDTDTSIPLSNDNGASDPEKAFWDGARSLLDGRSKNPGAFIQKCLRDHGKELTVAAFNAAQLEKAVDPLAYIGGYFRRHGERQAARPVIPI